ncbi:MAG: hypothetical protein KGN77_16935 [Xanthomonadaceae bacterium]|nr:hypothetical protein [Xanthomonadaceae bacterium]MDE1965578.1 hypothetical protein [Xanthomonadaceae bacterium]
MRRIAPLVLAIALVALGALPVSGRAAPPQDRPAPASQAGQVYGWQLMTPAERDAYRQQMRNTRTPQEREALRARHHEQMQQRARERGVRLPDIPPPGGGMGRGMGRGMGPGMQPANPQPMRQRAREGAPATSGQGQPVRTQNEKQNQQRSSGGRDGGL